MRLLLDECLPKDLANELPGHHVRTVPQAGWASISNGRLLRLIAASGKFDVFLTIDKKLPQQQKVKGLPFAVVVLRAKSNRLEHVFPSLRKCFVACRISDRARFTRCRSPIEMGTGCPGEPFPRLQLDFLSVRLPLQATPSAVAASDPPPPRG